MSNENHTSIHKKLNDAREQFHAKTQTKSGHNKFAGYTYFELGDFLPDALKAFNAAGLCGIISFGAEEATMRITDVETGAHVTITTPMSKASLKGCHEVQNLGAVQTYLRRYLWASAIELVEASSVDASVGKEEETLPKDNYVAKKFPSVPLPEKKREPAPVAGRQTWVGHILEVRVVKEGDNANGHWALYAIEMDEDRSATTIKETLANDARIIGPGVQVKATVEPNKRSPGNWSWLNFEPVEEKQDELGYLKE